MADGSFWPGRAGSFVGLAVSVAVIASVVLLGSADAATLSVTLVKTVDADGDSVFNKVESPPFIGAPVTFRVEVANTDSVPYYITSLTDASPSGAPGQSICPNFLGTVLAPNQTITCVIPLVGGAPPTVRTDKARVTVARGIKPGPAGQPPVPCADPDPNACMPCVVASPMSTTTSTIDCSAGGGPSVGEAEDELAFGPPPPLMMLPSVTVDKTNDASGDGSFATTETAGAPGDPVTFQVVITNTSGLFVTIDSVTDESPPGSGAGPVCAQLLGTVLPPFGSATCTYTVAGYAPAAGSTRENVVMVGVSASGMPAAGTGHSFVVTRTTTTSSSSTTTSSTTSTTSSTTSTTSTSSTSTSTTSTSTSTTTVAPGGGTGATTTTTIPGPTSTTTSTVPPAGPAPSSAPPAVGGDASLAFTGLSAVRMATLATMLVGLGFGLVRVAGKANSEARRQS